MSRWLLLVLSLLLGGCVAMESSSVDSDLPLTPPPTRPSLSLPTRPARTSDLPRIRSSFDLPPPERTPFAWVTPATEPTSADALTSPTPGSELSPTITPDPAGFSPTPTVSATPTRRPTATRQVVHRFAVSTRARLYYYCDTDSAWKSLSPANLRWYDSEAKLRADYPRLTLHEPCR